MEAPGVSSGLLILDAEDAPSKLMYALLSHYDKDSDQKLSKQELILPAGLFDKLDTDKDGFLDSNELANLFENRVVEVDFNVELDRSLLRGKVLTDPSDKALTVPELVLVADGTMRLTVGMDLLTLQARGDLPESLEGFREGLLKRFQGLQSKKGEAVPLQQLSQGSPVALGGADRNNDGKISEEELKSYLDVLFNLLTSCPIFTFTDSGQGLMAALDPHADSQLRLFDVRSAWSRMAGWDRDKDGAVSREEIPRQCHLLFEPGRSRGWQRSIRSRGSSGRRCEQVGNAAARSRLVLQDGSEWRWGRFTARVSGEPVAVRFHRLRSRRFHHLDGSQDCRRPFSRGQEEAMTQSSIPGRGTATNPPNRFERLNYEVLESDEDGEPNRPKTVFYRDDSKSVIAFNDSPDVGFSASINPYRGCEHGCAYCYARPYHEYLGLSAGLDFETKIFIKEDAPELLRAELASKRWQPQTLGISGVTDAYQPIERQVQITRRCLQVCLDFRNPVVIVTKNHLVTRDIDVLAELAQFQAAVVFISVTTLDASLARKLEPRASQPEAKLAAIRAVGGRCADRHLGRTDHTGA